MRGISRILGTSFLFLGVLLPSFSSPLQAQTAEELKRVEELRKREHEVQQEIKQRLMEVREERLVQVEEALARAREQVAQVEGRTREEHAAQLREMEHALAEARAQMEAGAEQSEARLRQEEALARSKAQFQEARDQMRDQERKIRQLVVSVRGRARLGVSMNGNQGEELDRQGVRIEGVIPDTPAEDAGLQEGDVVTHLNGQALVDPIPGEGEEDFDESESLPVQRLISIAGALDAGDEVEIRYLRDGERHSVTVEAAEIDQPSVMVFGGDLGDVEGRRILRVGPGGEGVWSMSGSDDELVALKLSELSELQDLEDLRIHLKDMKVDLEDMHLDLTELGELDELRAELRDLYVDAPGLRITSGPEGRLRGYTVMGGESPVALRVLGGRVGHGLKITSLNPGLAEYFDTDSGLLVLEVDEDSATGLLAGDVILAIDGRDVEEQEDVGRILNSYQENEVISFLVVRKGQQVEVEGTIR